MSVERGFKIVLYNENGKARVEIKKHKDEYMENILIVQSIGSKKYEDVWIIQKDLENWITSIKKEGFTIIKKEEDVESPKKNITKKKK